MHWQGIMVLWCLEYCLNVRVDDRNHVEFNYQPYLNLMFVFICLSQVLGEKMGVPDREALKKLRKDDRIDHSLDYLVVKLGTKYSFRGSLEILRLQCRHTCIHHTSLFEDSTEYLFLQVVVIGTVRGWKKWPCLSLIEQGSPWVLLCAHVLGIINC